MENQNHAFNYAYLLKQVKARVLLAQKKAIYTANEEMLSMYWDIGKLIYDGGSQDFKVLYIGILANDYMKVGATMPLNSYPKT